MSTLYHFRVQIAKFSTRKTHSKPKLQENVPANNCHPKVDTILQVKQWILSYDSHTIGLLYNYMLAVICAQNLYRVHSRQYSTVNQILQITYVLPCISLYLLCYTAEIESTRYKFCDSFPLSKYIKTSLPAVSRELRSTVKSHKEPRQTALQSTPTKPATKPLPLPLITATAKLRPFLLGSVNCDEGWGNHWDFCRVSICWWWP